jgi:hypothetical protein
LPVFFLARRDSLLLRRVSPEGEVPDADAERESVSKVRQREV